MNIDRVPDHGAFEGYRQIFERIAGQSPFPNLVSGSESKGGDDIRHFDDEAQAAFNEWYEGNERLCRSDTLPPVITSHLSKYASLVPSLALILAVADGVTGDVPVQYVRQAVGWANYLRPHAERAFVCTTRPDTAHARALLAKIKASVVGDGFTVREICQHEWSMLATREAVEMAVALLVDHDYLMAVEVPSSNKGGRGTVSYRINPKIRT